MTSSRSRQRIGSALFAAPALIVPIAVIAAIIWARESFYLGHAAAFKTGSPTISRAISEPGIAVTFATTVTLAAALLALICWRILVMYAHTIRTVFPDRARGRTTAFCLVGLAGAAQACSVTGIVSLSWLTERTLHIGSSYLFFFGQACAILFISLICIALLKQEPYRNSGVARQGLSPRLSRVRAVAGPAIAATAVVFWILFLIRDAADPVPKWLDQVFSTLEIVLIFSFLGYLAGFSVELYRWHRARSEAGHAIPVVSRPAPT